MNERLIKMELHKIKTEIKRNGTNVVIKRETKDDYGEPTGEETEVTTACGLLHISRGYLSKSVGDATVTHAKGQPMFMMEFENTSNVFVGDYFVLNNTRYNIVAKNNVNEMNIVCDLSLELVNNANQN